MRTTAVIEQVDVWSLCKVAFILYATLGLIAGMFYGFVFLVLGRLGNFLGDADIPGIGYLTGVVGILAVPALAVLYGIVGSLIVAIGGVLYNLAARWVGGVRIDLRDATPTHEAPPPAPQEPPTVPAA